MNTAVNAVKNCGEKASTDSHKSNIKTFYLSKRIAARPVAMNSRKETDTSKSITATNLATCAVYSVMRATSQKASCEHQNERGNSPIIWKATESLHGSTVFRALSDLGTASAVSIPGDPTRTEPIAFQPSPNSAAVTLPAPYPFATSRLICASGMPYRCASDRTDAPAASNTRHCAMRSPAARGPGADSLLFRLRMEVV